MRDPRHYLDGAWRLAILTVLTAIGVPAGTAPAQAPASGEEVYNIFPPVQREYRLALSRAEKAIQDEDFATAVDELTSILNGDDPNDYFVGKPGSKDAQTSIKTQALRLLGSLPPQGRRQYELMSGHDARAALDKALEAGDLPALTDVARRYFHTQAGYEAAILLGRLQLDQGRPLAAALHFQRVAEVEAAAAQFDPELSILLATSWLHAREREKAAEVLASLKKRMPKARVRTGDGEAPLFDDEAGALAWLEKLVGDGGTARKATATQWVMFRGNEARNASTVASLPLLNYRWSLPVVGDLADQQRIRQAMKTNGERESIVPAVQPLVVNNYVIFRTPDHVVGAELDTGKRIWIFPWDQTTSEKLASAAGVGSRSPAVVTREQELYQRLYQDHAFGQLSSDGEQVFMIDEIGLAPTARQNVPRNVVLGVGRVVPNNLWSRPFNKLVSLDIKRQGALKWIVGGETGVEEPKLAGAFFLGPPLPLGGTLYALAEFNGEVRLVALKAATGALEWQQTLASMTELQTVPNDVLRRLSGATPSFANGVLVCPTSGGGVVAVDVATRTLRWGYQYPRNDVIYYRPNFPFQPQQQPNGEDSSRWVDSAVTIADGCVLLTPPESDKLHCLDLISGKAKWEPQPRGEMLYVACVHDGKAILVGRSQVKAIKLASGEPAWQASLDLAGENPTGRGYYSDQFYYLPVSSGQLLKIDLAQGQVTARVKTEVPLGNLVCYQGSLVSQSAELLTSFYLSDPLRKRIDEMLAKNPDDAWALSRKGEIALQDGKARDGVALLRKAHEILPDEQTKSMLVRVILSLLRENYDTHADLAAEAAPLVTDPALKREFQRLRADAMYKAGQHWEAFENYLALGQAPLLDAEPMEEVARDHLVRRDRWAAGRLASLFEAADEGTRGKMTAEIQSRLDAARQSGSAEKLREFVTLFHFHPLATEATLLLAQNLADANQALEAESHAGSLSASASPETAARATAILASIYQKAGRLDLATACYRELADKYADVVCRDQLTGKQVAEAAAGDAELSAYPRPDAWPEGMTEAKAGNEEGIRGGFGDQRFQVPIADYRGAAPAGMRASYSQREQAIHVRSGLGRLIANVSVARSGSPFNVYYGGNGNIATARAGGHVVVVGLMGEVIAIDALRARGSGEGVLWRQEVLEPDPTGRRTFMTMQSRQLFNPLLGGSRTTSFPDPRFAVSFGPVTRLGVCFQRNRQLVCADPISGKTMWERALPQTGCDIFGDEEKIVVVPPNQGNEQAPDALIINPVDGEIIDRRKIDPAERRWATCGRNVLVWEQAAGGGQKVLLYDASNQGTGLWGREDEWPQGSRGCIIDGQELALMKPDGTLKIVSLKDGKELVSRQLAKVANLESLVVLRSQEQYLVFVNQQPTPAERAIINEVRIGVAVVTPVHGNLYALDRATGKELWPAPAFISQQGLPADQPSDSPVLFFVRNMSRTRTRAGRSQTTSVLALDKRDGRVLYWEESFMPQAIHADVLADPLQKQVALTLSTFNESRTVTIKLTDQPTPPQPPAQTDYLASLTAGDLPGTVDPSIDAAVELMQRAGRARNLPGGVLPVLPIPGGNFPGIPPVPPRP